MVTQGDTPDWQGANTNAGGVQGSNAILNLAAGASLTLLNTVPGGTYLLYGLGFTWNSATAALISIETTAGIGLYAYYCIGQSHGEVPLYGLKLPTGVGLRARNISGINQGANDIINYYFQLT